MTSTVPHSGLPAEIGVRVGTDIVPVARVESLVRSNGERFLTTLLDCDELRDCTTVSGLDLPAVASRLAAKEAVFKTFHAAHASLPWLSIRVRTTPGGWPEPVLTGIAQRLAVAAGLGAFSLSLSHDGGFAVAVAVATASR
ncbi:holo-ACP synthase [Streptomyces sp. IMTB 2501]|uniref:holo-ACP synthase n=1 Tax=Streptomyces sp. IMTB 2501 TaxID=1776340 RepID=UPI0021160557|nr:4'-phosphopantetheinyl transferase superfamily protein [Streptomyces sp. IMTB 2501]